MTQIYFKKIYSNMSCFCRLIYRYKYILFLNKTQAKATVWETLFFIFIAIDNDKL